MRVAELFASVEGMALPEAAARFAGAGMPVFPCVPGGKRPLVGHGFHEATTNVEQVVGWWRRWPGANIGVPTGAASGVEVVDVDRKANGSGFDGFRRARVAGLIPGWLAVVRTPSGGMHAYFPASPLRLQPSWQAANAHVDFRGDGGYVIVPPSVVTRPDGTPGRYALVAGSVAAPNRVDARMLREFLDPRQPAHHRPREGIASAGDAVRLAGWVAALGEGERNRGLFWAACRLAEAGTDPAATLDALAPAAKRAGLPPREVEATVRSAYRTVNVAPAGPDTGRFGHGSSLRLVRAARRVLS